MEPEEIYAEVERRKQKAKDLKLREVLWTLYRRHLKIHPELRARDPELAYPGFGLEELKVSGCEIVFPIGSNLYRINYKKQKPREEGGEGILERETITEGTMALRVNDVKVFKFEWSESTRYGRYGPVWEERLGEITRFIDGPWVLELADLLARVTEGEGRVRHERNAPGEAKRLEDLKKRFGF